MINKDTIKKMIQVHGKSYLTREAMEEVFDLGKTHSNKLEICPLVVNFCQDENLLCRYIAPESISHVDKWEFVPRTGQAKPHERRVMMFFATYTYAGETGSWERLYALDIRKAKLEAMRKFGRGVIGGEIHLVECQRRMTQEELNLCPCHVRKIRAWPTHWEEL